MGLLTEGRPLSWEETKALAEHVRKHGIEQFISLYERLRDRQGDILKWGDEVEYILVRFDEDRRTAQVSLTAVNLLKELNRKEEEDPTGGWTDDRLCFQSSSSTLSSSYLYL